jgi:hypothetical protein
MGLFALLLAPCCSSLFQLCSELQASVSLPSLRWEGMGHGCHILPSALSLAPAFPDLLSCVSHFFFFEVLEFELRVYTLSHSTTLFL